MKIPWFKYFLSYFYLVTIKKIPSEYNPGLCIQMEAGRLLLNTTNANTINANTIKPLSTVLSCAK